MAKANFAFFLLDRGQRIKKSKEDQQDTKEGTTTPPKEHSPQGIIDPGFHRPVAQTEYGNNQNEQ
ncbi:MAG: hypothetical protein ACON38_09100, partial [Akkermansiaceae bacterium]